ncbi:MAG: hypothetical protein EXR72_20700 [Myxococcales bacterium]|nr:hypothetical protein [Myxococcales bacterium]
MRPVPSTRSALAFVLVPGALALAACGTGAPPGAVVDPRLLPGFAPTPPALDGEQILLAPVRGLAPGSDSELCTWTDRVPERDLFIKRVKGFQTAGGHHVVIYATRVLQPPGTTRLCTDDDMVTFQLISVAAGEGIAGTEEAPEGLAFRVPAGSQIVVNQHFINATASKMDAQAALNIEYPPAGQKFTPVGYTFFTDTQFKFGPGNPSLDVSCRLDRDYRAWLLLPHMHEWGSRIRIEHDQAPAGTKVLFDLPEWQKDWAFHPPQLRKDIADLYTFKKDDTVRVHCEWQTDHEITFGREMCVLMAMTEDRDGTGNRVCDHGTWHSF